MLRLSRADRIETVISLSDEHDVQSMQELQLDSRDGGAANLVSFLIDAPSPTETVADMQAMLDLWSRGAEAFQARGDSQGAAVYQATWRHLLKNTFHDELPEDYWPGGGSRWFGVVKLLLQTPTDPWWDDVNTDFVEGRDDILVKSMIDAHEELTELLGGNRNGWTWGKLHIAHFENQVFGQSGIGPIEWLFNRKAPARVGGGTSLVNAVGWDTSVSYVVDWVPSMRMVVDLSDLSNSTMIHTTGQSGHAFHTHYRDMIEMWTDGIHGPMYWTREQVTGNAAATLTMVPATDD